MAKKTTRKPAARHYPVQTTMGLAEASTTYGNVRLIEGDRLLSMTNRRMYRQSRVYSMKVDIDPFALVGQGAAFSVYCLRDTWDLHGAYKYAMKTFYNAMKEELEIGGARTRWHDFRVLPDFQSDELNGYVYQPDNALPQMNGIETFLGDHQFTEVVDAAGTSQTFGLDTTSGSGVLSIIQEWNKKDRVDADPAVASTSMSYAGIVEDYDEANYDSLRVRGDAPPYQTTADQDLWHKVCTIKQVNPDGVAKLSTGFFEAPLGLVVLVSPTFTTTPSEHGLVVSYQKGDYKGVKAPSYATPVLTDAKEYEVV